MLKPGADAAFCDGVNHFIWHTFTASPPEFGKPGIEYFAGTHINPNVTWCRAGRPVPRLPRPLPVPAAAGPLRGRRLLLHRRQRLSALGPRRASGASKPTLALGKGYTYDLVNTEVLLDRLSVDGRRLVLPDGMRYRLLVVDLADETARPRPCTRSSRGRGRATVVLGQRRRTRPA